MSSGWHIIHRMSSGRLSRNWYLIRMSYDNAVMSSGWHRLPFVSHPDEIANFDFPHHAVALQRFRTHAIDPETRSHKIITSTPLKAVFGYLTNKAKQNKNKQYHCHDKWPQATITDWWHCAKFKWHEKCRIGQNDRQRRRQKCHMLSNCINFLRDKLFEYGCSIGMSYNGMNRAMPLAAGNASFTYLNFDLGVSHNSWNAQ